MLKYLLTVVSIFGLLLVFPPAAHSALESADIDTINQAADALQSSDPDLSQNLSQFAQDQEAAQTQGQAVMTEQSDIQLLRDSSSALQETDPQLADQVGQIADKAEQGSEGMPQAAPDASGQGGMPEQGADEQY